MKIIQLSLNEMGYTGKNGEKLVVDGVFGDNTLYAVKKFQSSQNIIVDGLVGDETWESMGLMLDNDVTERIYYETLRAIYENIISYMPEGSSISDGPDIYMGYLFYEMVRLNGPLDLKNQPGWDSRYFIFDGKVVRHDAPGNIAYGIAGKILKFDEQFLLAAAGYAQGRAGNGNEAWNNFEYYGDDPIDQLNIRYGFEFYDERMRK